MVLQENVVVAPEELESRHGDDGLRLRWSLVEIGPQQSGIVLDVLEHVHQQEEIGIARCDLPTESQRLGINLLVTIRRIAGVDRSEEHTSELQSLMRISYAVFCLKKTTTSEPTTRTHTTYSYNT